MTLWTKEIQSRFLGRKPHTYPRAQPAANCFRHRGVPATSRLIAIVLRAVRQAFAGARSLLASRHAWRGGLPIPPIGSRRPRACHPSSYRPLAKLKPSPNRSRTVVALRQTLLRNGAGLYREQVLARVQRSRSGPWITNNEIRSPRTFRRQQTGARLRWPFTRVMEAGMVFAAANTVRQGGDRRAEPHYMILLLTDRAAGVSHSASQYRLDSLAASRPIPIFVLWTASLARRVLPRSIRIRPPRQALSRRTGKGVRIRWH